jgi:regulator of sirC expression with transglutaminase-like and TPR domain
VLQSTVELVDDTERFAEVVTRPDDDVALDIAALLIAAHAHPGLDFEAPLAELDRLAAAVPDGDAATVAEMLFTRSGGFAGNTEDYGDPRNSFLDDVLARRLGIPLSLSVVMMEVGRRCDIGILGVGMPGHFLVRPSGVEDVWFDPFHGGRRLDEDGCRELFESVRGAGVPFNERFLAPVGARTILNRMLANLQHSYLAREPPSVAWVARLRLVSPGLTVPERRDVAVALASAGRFVDAARVLDELASERPEAEAKRLEREAAAYRARAN